MFLSIHNLYVLCCVKCVHSNYYKFRLLITRSASVHETEHSWIIFKINMTRHLDEHFIYINIFKSSARTYLPFCNVDTTINLPRLFRWRLGRHAISAVPLCGMPRPMINWISKKRVILTLPLRLPQFFAELHAHYVRSLYLTMVINHFVSQFVFHQGYRRTSGHHWLILQNLQLRANSKSPAQSQTITNVN